jgi:hypothetical protein
MQSFWFLLDPYGVFGLAFDPIWTKIKMGAGHFAVANSPSGQFAVGTIRRRHFAVVFFKQNLKKL